MSLIRRVAGRRADRFDLVRPPRVLWRAGSLDRATMWGLSNWPEHLPRPQPKPPLWFSDTEAFALDWAGIFGNDAPVNSYHLIKGLVVRFDDPDDFLRWADENDALEWENFTSRRGHSGWESSASSADVRTDVMGRVLRDLGAVGWWLPGYFGSWRDEAKETEFARGADIAIYNIADLRLRPS